VIDSRREENRRIISPLMSLISNPWPSSRATHSSPNRAVSASSRCWAVIADQADVLVVAQGVRGPPSQGQPPTSWSCAAGLIPLYIALNWHSTVFGVQRLALFNLDNTLQDSPQQVVAS
jgi:hypothetical protein